MCTVSQLTNKQLTKYVQTYDCDVVNHLIKCYQIDTVVHSKRRVAIIQGSLTAREAYFNDNIDFVGVVVLVGASAGVGVSEMTSSFTFWCNLN